MIKPSEMTEIEIIQKVAAKINNLSRETNSSKSFDLSFAQCVKLFRKTEKCAYTGEQFEDWSDITFERINPIMGYVDGNVVLVKTSINAFKGRTLDSFFRSNPMDGEEAGKLLVRLGKELIKRTKAKKQAQLEIQQKTQARLTSLAQQTQMMRGITSND